MMPSKFRVRREIEDRFHLLGAFEEIADGEEAAACEYCGGRVILCEWGDEVADQALMLPCTERPKDGDNER